MSFAEKWIELETFMSTEISQTQKGRCYMLSCRICIYHTGRQHIESHAQNIERRMETMSCEKGLREGETRGWGESEVLHACAYIWDLDINEYIC